MAEDRYSKRGYSASLLEEAHGAYLTIRRNGKVVAEVALAILSGGEDAPVEIAIKRFRPKELRKVTTTDDFEPPED